MAMAPSGKHRYVCCNLGSTTNEVVTVVDVHKAQTLLLGKTADK
jgi:hypothetical protein